ncbi:MAG: TolC family protein [Marinilabiliales bacterium]|nr:TolC family protein [Marinilabiliales bacterium]
MRAAGKQVVAAAKAFWHPGLSAGGAIFTGYYQVLGDEASEQLFISPPSCRTTTVQAVYLSLNVPIFSRYAAGRTIRLAKIRKSDAELKLELEKNNLYTEIENACLNYNRGKDEFSAAASQSRIQ